MSTLTQITDSQQATPELLTERFRVNGFLRSGRVSSVKVSDSFESSCATWDRLTLIFSDDYEGDVPGAIVLKVYRKGWFGGGVVEWTFYSELAPQTPDSQVCPVYDCRIEHESKQCYFLMPDLSVTHQDPPKEVADRPHAAVLEELLKYHIRWWNDSRLDQSPFWNLHGGPLRMAQAIAEDDVRKSCARFQDALKPLVKALGDELEPPHLATIERVIRGYPDVFLERVSESKHITLLHGDAHLWNLFYPKDPTKDRIILFDWETYKRGLGPYDLAYLLIHGTSGRKELEGSLMDFYYSGLVSGGIEGYSREEFEYDFRLSVLACVFCPIIWKRGFSVRSSMAAYEDWDCEALLK